MKVFNFFIHIFAIFAFLTLGSLLMIVGLHILSVDDALLRVNEIYAHPWKSIQTVLMGLLFITVGLNFTKSLVKKGKTDAMILQSEMGPIVVSINAIEDITRKVLKRFHLAKEWKIATEIGNKSMHIQIRLILWSGGNVQELLAEIQEDAKSRLRKLVGNDVKIEITCDVHRIEDHEILLKTIERAEAAV